MEFQAITDMTAEDLAALAAAMGVVTPAAARWSAVSSSKYTASAPASTSTVTFSDTADLAMGLPVRIEQSGAYSYGRITGITTDTLLTIAGEPLTAATPITALEIGLPELLVAMPLPLVDGTYGDGTTTGLIAEDTPARVRWMHGPARIIDFELVHVTDDTTANPKLNLRVGGTNLSTADSTNGLQVSTTWQNNGVAIDTANNAVALADTIDLAVTVAGTAGDAADLTAVLYAVLTD